MVVLSIYHKKGEQMRKKLFERYAELNCYRLALQPLQQNGLITRAARRAVEAKISQVEMSLIIPKQNKIHPRTLTRVK